MKLSQSIVSVVALTVAAPATSAFQSASPPTAFVARTRGVTPTFFQETQVISPTRSSLSSSVLSAPASVDTVSSEIDLFEEANAIFYSVDDNGDGMISIEELRAHLVDQMGYTTKYTQFIFDSMDMDSDGEISRDEFRFAFYNFEGVSLYLTMGVGGKDLTSSPAFHKTSKQLATRSSSDTLRVEDFSDMVFAMIDTDESGEIDSSELKAHFDTVTAQVGTDGQGNTYVSDLMSILDANKDGVIQPSEMRNAFSKFDFKFLAETFGLRVYRAAEAY